MGIEADKRDAEFRAKLAAKKTAVMKAVGRCQKTGRNESQHYTYAEAREVYTLLRAAMIDAGLCVSVACTELREIGKVGRGTPLFSLDLYIGLVDVETGYQEIHSWQATAMDSGDKAIYKAMTSGLKYWLLHNFLIPTDDDVERDNGKDGTEEPPKNLPDAPDPVGKEFDLVGSIYRRVCEITGRELDADKFRRALYHLAGRYPQEGADIERSAKWLIERNIVGLCE